MTDEIWVIETGFKYEGLARDVSNLCPYAFVLDGVSCGSMEGFLQSLKTNDPDVKRRIAAMHGFQAYREGQNHNYWKDSQTLYWNGESHPRLSKKYQRLIERAYDACFDSNPDFAAALSLTGDSILKHSMGKRNPTNSTLTEHEYIYNLYRLRARVQQMLRRLEPSA